MQKRVIDETGQVWIIDERDREWQNLWGSKPYLPDYLMVPRAFMLPYDRKEYEVPSTGGLSNKDAVDDKRMEHIIRVTTLSSLSNSPKKNGSILEYL